MLRDLISEDELGTVVAEIMAVVKENDWNSLFNANWPKGDRLLIREHRFGIK